MNFQALAEQLQGAPRPLQPNQDAPRVLVVEPHPKLRRALVTLLRMRHMTVSEAADATLAPQATREWRPTVVVMDPGLPDLGARILGRLHKIDPHLPVIVYTSPRPEAVKLLTDAGAYRVILKGTGAVQAVVTDLTAAHGAYTGEAAAVMS